MPMTPSAISSHARHSGPPPESEPDPVVEAGTTATVFEDVTVCAGWVTVFVVVLVGCVAVLVTVWVFVSVFAGVVASEIAWRAWSAAVPDPHDATTTATSNPAVSASSALTRRRGRSG